MKRYQQILYLLDDGKFYRIYQYEFSNPFTNFKQTKNIFDKYQLLNVFILGFKLSDLSFLFRTLFKQSLFVKPERTISFKRKVFLPLLRYLIKSHIRRQLEKLYSIYLVEIVTQNQNFNQNDIEELRKISSDIKNYKEELPSSMKTVTTLVFIFSSIFGVIQFFGMTIQLTDFLSSEWTIIGFLLIGFLAFFITSSPLLAAFRAKRAIFLNSNSLCHAWDVYFVNENTYEKSVYKIEDELYDKLNKKHQKPKEIAIDKIIIIIMSIIFISFIIVGSHFNLFTTTNGNAINNWIAVILLMLFFIWQIVSAPLEYRRRKQHGLV